MSLKNDLFATSSFSLAKNVAKLLPFFDMESKSI